MVDVIHYDSPYEGRGKEECPCDTSKNIVKLQLMEELGSNIVTEG